ncbi:MAG: hypothetical protein DRP66_09180, partial [Planctomycetota bacterium]
VIIAGTGAVITYNYVTNRDKPAETVGAVAQDSGTQSSAGRSVALAPGNSTNKMSKEEFEEWYFGETVDEKAADSPDIPQPAGGFAGGSAQVQNTQPTGTSSQPAAYFGGGYGGGFRGRVSILNFSSPKQTVTSFVRVLSGRDMNQISKCFVEGAPDLEDLRRIMEDPQSEGDLQMKLILESIGSPVEVVSSAEEANGLGVTWLSTVKREFSVGSTTYQPGDKFELDATLVQIENKWKIAGI